jgi:hypothetical protein
VDGIEEEPNERCESGSEDKMIESTKLSHQKSELVAYHKIKRKFLNLVDMEKEDPKELQICEFNGQDFELITD